MAEDTRTGRVRETYVAALQNDAVGLDDASLVGVVRQPTGWFRSAVDENRPALGPPAELLDAVKERHKELKLQGMCDEGAHNAAWEDLDFEACYREYVRETDEAQAAVADLTERVRQGETVVLVCFEGENKRGHRRVLADLLEDRLAE